jgi:YHS domain-containing protein
MRLTKTSIAALAVIVLACTTRAEKGEPTAGAREEPKAATPAANAPAPSSPTTQGTSAPLSALTEITDPSQVCMVNNQYMGRPQIPTTVEGKTYYGCCPMCKGRLEKEASARTAKDPVSGREVDKAVAVIGKQESGDVLYFESRQTLAAYRSN